MQVDRSPGTIGEADAADYVLPPLRVGSASDLVWDEEADVLVVGFGGAGACAAIEARQQGADVLVLERFQGGGATALSGGIYYGGATRHLKEAGFNDTPRAMFDYLKQEIGETVKDSTLWRFCEESSANLEWLEAQGVRFGHRAYDGKVTYPPPGYDLYYSGNERVAGNVELAPPAPRGHRVVGPNFTGATLHDLLSRSAEKLGVRVRRQAAVTRLVVGANGTVLGVQASALLMNSAAARQHQRLLKKVNSYQRFFPVLALRTAEKVRAIEQAHGKPLLVRAHRGVVLSSGSFSFNSAMMRDHAPKYVSALPLGTLGCDGSGVKLGRSLGAAIGCMDKVTAWRSISPPTNFVKGLVVNRQGRRFVSEDLYLGTLGYHIAEHQQGQAWLVIDRATYRAAFPEVLPRPGTNWVSLGAPQLINLLFNMKKGSTPAELARRCGIDPAGLEATVQEFNGALAAGRGDPLRKGPKYCQPLGAGPYYALDISIGNKRNPCTTIPMGGLMVDEDTGSVLNEQGGVIAGLYAAGRAAVGIPSGFYVSGTSIADCVFSGRRAGLNAARAPGGAS